MLPSSGSSACAQSRTPKSGGIGTDDPCSFPTDAWSKACDKLRRVTCQGCPPAGAASIATNCVRFQYQQHCMSSLHTNHQRENTRIGWEDSRAFHRKNRMLYLTRHERQYMVGAMLFYFTQPSKLLSNAFSLHITPFLLQIQHAMLDTATSFYGTWELFRALQLLTSLISTFQCRCHLLLSIIR